MLCNFNGYDVKYVTNDRYMTETLYIQLCYKEYLKQMKVTDEKERKIESIDDPDFATYIEENHPRWYALAIKTEF